MSHTTIEQGSRTSFSAQSTRRFPPIAWHMSLRFMGWIGIAASIFGILLLMLGDNDPQNPFSFANALRAVEAVVPLVIGVQAAFALSPDDEPGLEMMAACPRPLGWMLLERLGVTLLVQIGIALAGTILSLTITGETDPIIAIVRWFSPMLFFAGVGAYITIRSRQPSFSIAVLGVLWFIFSFMGVLLLPGMETFWPLSVIQPYLWPFHAYLQPGQMNMNDYWFNRLMVALAGVGLLLLTLWYLRDEERVLFGNKTSKRSFRSNQ